MSTDISTLDEAILELLPTERHEIKWISTPDTKQRLLDKGHHIYLKKVRRHLITLEAKRLVISRQEDGAREILWQRVPFFAGANRAASLMVASEAVAFNMLERFTTQLPKAILSDIDNLFRAAEVRLSQEHADGRLHRAWPDKVDSVDGTFALARPALKEDAFNVIKTALFFERVVHVKYRPMSMAENDEPRMKPLWPLALVESAGVMYLVAEDPAHKPRPEKGKHKPLRSVYRLDRVREAHESKENFAYPKDFKLRDFIDNEQQFNFMVEAPVFMRLAFEGNSGNHLFESKMSTDQKAPIRLVDGRLLVEGTVRPSLKLRWWLRSFGANVEILEPQSLRDEFAADFKRLAQRYS
ncbi:putative DNA-binding transcriptional regulator YafY [Paraburkholderia sp. GAS333]|uniref:helix-turn-helix transcriptional regulator n=1 Tax=Paraburkholderia sp. GAS333 TaxID=3156279 RepID=UPI003D1B3442